MVKNKRTIIVNTYILCVCMYCFMSILNSTYFDDIFSLYGKVFSFSQNIFIMLFSFLTIINTKLTKKRILVIYALLIIFGLIVLKNTDKSLIILITMLFAFPTDLKVSNLTKKIILTNIITIGMVVIFCKLGFITDYQFVQRNVLRHSLGFVSANALSNLVSATMLMYIFHKKDKLSFFNILVCGVILLITSFQTNSRAAMLLGFFAIIISLVLKKTIKISNSKVNNFIYFTSKYIFAFLFIASIAFTIYISSIPHNQSLNNLNELFTGRINQMIEFYNQYGIHLIGKPIFVVGIKNAITSGQKWIGIDTAYLNYTLRYGLIFMAILSIFYKKMCNKLQTRKLLFDASYIIIICILGLTENILLLPYYNCALFLIASCLKQKEQGEM